MSRPDDATTRRRRSELEGRIAEWIAAVLLVLRGYWIIERRGRLRAGEVDLIAVRGRRLAFIEVKWRRDRGCAAEPVGRRQIARVGRAAQLWTWRHAAYRNHVIGLDCVVLTPWSWPRYHENALQPVG